MNTVSGGIEFDWDATNTRHLKSHRVTADEFEELMRGDQFIWSTRRGAMKNDIRFWVRPRPVACLLRSGRLGTEWSGLLPRTLPVAFTGTFIGRLTDETEARNTRL